MRGWGVALLGLALDYAVLLLTRGPAFGAIAGNEMRYLTVASLYLALGLGVVLLPLRGAPGSSRPRSTPLLALRLTPVIPVALATVVVVGSLASSITYVRTWQTDNPGRTYVQNVAAAAAADPTLDLLDGTVPPEVMSPVLAPYDRASVLLPLHVPGVTFPEVSNDLQVATADGSVAPARVPPATTTLPGPIAGCGWRVGAQGRTFVLDHPTIDYDWWLRVGYLASQRSVATVAAGNVTRQAVLNPSLGSLFVHVPGAYGEVRIEGLYPGTTLCVDVIDVGVPEAGDR